LHVLLIEDDDLVAHGIAAGLRLHGFTVDRTDTAARADAAIDAATFDIAILDLGLPDRDGLELLVRWRARGRHLPVLVLTARDAVEHRVTGLRSGADDYLLKPFDLDELVARLHALLRRAAGRSTDRIVHGRLAFDPASGELRVAGAVVELSRRERALLAALLQHPRQVLTPEQLRDRVYGIDQEVESNAVNVHVHHLRRKLGPDAIETVRGVGYRMGMTT
jgi:two-component system, OmpR family, response regulator QseB